MTHEPPSAETTIAEIAERLGKKFPLLPASDVVAAVTEAYNEFEGAHVRDFVEVLVEKAAKKKLKKLPA